MKVIRNDTILFDFNTVVPNPEQHFGFQIRNDNSEANKE